MEDWKRPTLNEVKAILSSIDIKDVQSLLGVKRNVYYTWLQGKTNITKSNWELLVLYSSGQIDLNCNIIK